MTEEQKNEEKGLKIDYFNKKDDKEHFNSMYIIDPNGKLVLNYSKHFLYETDKKFCRAGKGFQSITIKTKTNVNLKIGIGICMDINPKDFIDYKLYELANFFIKEDIDFIGKLINKINFSNFICLGVLGKTKNAEFKRKFQLLVK